MSIIKLPACAVFVFALSMAAQQSIGVRSSSRIGIGIQNRRDAESIVKFRNFSTSPVTAVAVSLRRFASDGSIRLAWTRYYDSFITEAEKPVPSGDDMSLHFGKTMENGPDDELTVQAVIFEDGIAIGTPDYVSRLLTRRRTVRNALILLVKIGEKMTAQNVDLTAALDMARDFSEEQERLAVTPFEKNALVESVESFAENIRLNYRPGKPVFKYVRQFYVAKATALTESKPSIETAQ